MSEYVIDAYAWIEYLEGSSQGEIVRKILGNSTCFTSAVTLAEAISKAKRTNQDPQIVMDAILLNSRILPVEETAAFRAGLIHAEMKARNKSFGLADSFLLAQRTKKQKILTGDPHFSQTENVEMLK
ncbi:MAG: PIN domain-containing protein [Candidatus Diapherotrites archaeon]|nr:PIN domain-containing protein [Candidatus Diapherotrites archaeon]